MDARRSRTLGLMGQQVLAQQECARDEEWRLLRVVLIDLATRAQAGMLIGHIDVRAWHAQGDIMAIISC